MKRYLKTKASNSNSLDQPLRSEIIESEKARIDLLKYKLVAVAALGSIGLGLNKESSQHPLILALIPLVCIYVDLLCYHNTMRILVIGKYFKRTGCGYESYISNLGGTLSKFGLYLYRMKNNPFPPKSEKEFLVYRNNVECPDSCKKKEECKLEFNEISGISKNKNYVNLTELTNKTKKETCEENKINKYKKGDGYFFELEDWALYNSTNVLSCLVIAFSMIYLILDHRKHLWLFLKSFSSIHVFTTLKSYEPCFTCIMYLIVLISGSAGLLISLIAKKRFEDHKDTLFLVASILASHAPL